jgi:hypothetical protein
MAHVLIRPDGSERKVSGYQFKAPSPSAKKYAGSQARSNLPPKVDLRPYMTPVEDQGDLGSCVANAVAGAYEYLLKRHRGDDAWDVSRLYVYYNGRKRMGTEEEDSGTVISCAIDGLKEDGACSEDTWPYDVETFTEEPSEDAYSEGGQFLVEDVQLVPTTLDAWKSALADGYPIIFGLALYDSFDVQKKRGLVPLPSPKEASRESHSGHSMLCVGYSDPDQVFIVRNSWGTDWGDSGYCYIPYQYLVNPKYNDGDSWIIRQLENVDQDAGTWGDDESLIGDLDTELAKMGDDEFREMIDAMGSIPIETRLALVFLACAGADGDLADEELQGIAEYVSAMLEQLGSPYDGKKVLKRALDLLRKNGRRQVEESIAIFADHVPTTMLASMLRSLREIVGVDDVSEEEEAFLAHLVESWQIEDVDAEGGEGDDEESEGEDEDEDEDEESEGDDEESDDEDDESEDGDDEPEEEDE